MKHETRKGRKTTQEIHRNETLRSRRIKDILLRRATDPYIVEKVVFELEMPWKEIQELGMKVEDVMRSSMFQVNAIKNEMLRQMELEKENVNNHGNRITVVKKRLLEALHSHRPQGNYRS